MSLLLALTAPQAGSVEEMRRREAYERSQQLKRIQEETQRSRQLLEQRRQLQVGRGACGLVWRAAHAAAGGEGAATFVPVRSRRMFCSAQRM